MERITTKLYNTCIAKEKGGHIMKQNNMLAMILAGGRGTRLHDLTTKVANQPFHMEANTASLIFL